ncbi:hypothetical protein EIP91_000260 [Steccherinum ochraceum]|uniref:F-box domain-containing protein n=1 Tax=Steccherinum ochraceum TaxID=92696 RepID=A0A4R0RPR9_9APHY|nr:hypothetical protein EIP91_000260 [Steccherinum ochraceum]
MSPPPALPLEVCELIIDAVDEIRSEPDYDAKVVYGCVQDRVHALHACALTCRGWLPRARMHLQTCRPTAWTVLSTPQHLVSLVDFLRKAPHDADVELTGGTLIIAPSFRHDQTWVSQMPYELGPLLLRRTFVAGHSIEELGFNQVDLSVVCASPFEFYKSLLLVQTFALRVRSMQYSHLSQFARMVSVLDPVYTHCHGWFSEEERVRAGSDPFHPVAFRGNRIKELMVPVVWADLAHCDSWRFHTPHLSELTLQTRWPNSRFTLEDGDNTFRSFSKLFSVSPTVRLLVQDFCEVAYHPPKKFSVFESDPRMILSPLRIVMEPEAYQRSGLQLVADIITQVIPLPSFSYLHIIIRSTQPPPNGRDLESLPGDVLEPDYWCDIDDVLVQYDASEIKEVKVEFEHSDHWKHDSRKQWSTWRRFLPRAQQRGVVLRYRED